MRKPRTVRAWTLTYANSPDPWPMGMRFTRRELPRPIPGQRVLRVTIVPDGAPDPAAEVRRLRRALRAVRRLIHGADDGHGIVNFAVTQIDVALRRPRGGRKSNG